MHSEWSQRLSIRQAFHQLQRQLLTDAPNHTPTLPVCGPHAVGVLLFLEIAQCTWSSGVSEPHHHHSLIRAQQHSHWQATWAPSQSGAHPSEPSLEVSACSSARSSHWRAQRVPLAPARTHKYPAMQFSNVAGSHSMQLRARVSCRRAQLVAQLHRHVGISKCSWPQETHGRHARQCWVHDSTNGTEQSTETASSNGNGRLVGTSVDTQQQRQPLGSKDMECVATGMDVSCRVPDDDETSYRLSSRSDTSSGSSTSSSNGVNASAQSPSSSSSSSVLQQALAAALLVSPFFFWGTSMVAMKVRAAWSH